MKPLSLTTCLLAVLTGHALVKEVVAENTIPLPQAHAHNDYRHDRPLLDALDHGFCSVEADIFLVDGKLLVGHDRHELRPERTLAKLYLDPLRDRVRRNGGRVYRDGPLFTLLIDLKSDGQTTYVALSRLLAKYDDVFCSVRDGKVRRRAVMAVISGDRPQEMIAAENPRFAGIDGRLTDLDTDKPAHLMPLISDRWGSHFRWFGSGEMPQEERRKLHDAVANAHESGRRIRFCATPERESVWKELRAAGVDLINTDDLTGLQRFLSRQ